MLWQFETVLDAINELTETGHRVLGLDARERNDPGLCTEVPPYACDTAAPPDMTRQGALEAFGRPEAITGWTATNILITWSDPCRPH